MTINNSGFFGAVNRLNETYRQAHGLGSSTRGNPVLVAGERRDADRSEADVRAAAEAVKQAALDNRLSRGEPSEYWINVFWNRKHGRIETDTNHTALCDVYDEINDGYPSCDYLHTVYVRKVGSDRTVQTQYLEDDARRWSNG